MFCCRVVVFGDGCESVVLGLPRSNLFGATSSPGRARPHVDWNLEAKRASVGEVWSSRPRDCRGLFVSVVDDRRDWPSVPGKSIGDKEILIDMAVLACFLTASWF